MQAQHWGAARGERELKGSFRISKGPEGMAWEDLS